MDHGTIALTRHLPPGPLGLGGDVWRAPLSLPASRGANRSLVDRLHDCLGKHMRDICERGFADNDANHCAHFVSHVLGLSFGFTCGHMVHGTGDRASIRVQEIFPECPEVGHWDDLPDSVTAGLVFITRASHVSTQDKTMANVPRKHVGIFHGPTRQIWHYSNSRNRVVTQTPEEFGRHYRAPDNALFWGSFPVGANAG